MMPHGDFKRQIRDLEQFVSPYACNASLAMSAVSERKVRLTLQGVEIPVWLCACLRSTFSAKAPTRSGIREQHRIKQCHRSLQDSEASIEFFMMFR